MKLDKTSLLCVQALVCVLALCIAILVSASVTISGTIKDVKGDPIGNAKVSMSNGSSGEPIGERMTGGDGRYAFEGIPDGFYGLGAEYRGHDSNTFVTIPGNDPSAVDITMDDVSIAPSITPVPAPSAISTPRPAAWQVKYSRVGNDLYPVIQINLSWKRAYKLEPIAFDAGSTYDPDGSIVSYGWDFGDGSTGEGASVQHAYRDVGRYSVKFTVVDNAGAERSAFLTAVVSGRPPVSVPGNDTNATVGETVQLSGSGSYDPDGKIVKYEWSFGDGSTGLGMNVSHVYDRPDKYKVGLNVTDDDGLNATAYISVDVTGMARAPSTAEKSSSTQGIALLAGVGVACIAVMALMRRKSK